MKQVKNAPMKLKEMRKRAGLTLRDMAREAGYGDKWSSYRRYETVYKKEFLPFEFIKRILPVLVDRGEPIITADEVWKLAGVYPGIDGINDSIARAETASEIENNKKREIIVKEYDVNSSAGSGAVVYPDGGDADPHKTLGIWSFPKKYIESYVPNSDGLIVIRIQGNSMEPLFRGGDRVVVDTNHKILNPDGVYVFWNGLGLSVKQLQFIPKSAPPTVRIISVNPTYPTDVLLVDDIKICGRVIGRWDFL